MEDIEVVYKTTTHVVAAPSGLQNKQSCKHPWRSMQRLQATPDTLTQLLSVLSHKNGLLTRSDLMAYNNPPSSLSLRYSLGESVQNSLNPLKEKMRARLFASLRMCLLSFLIFSQKSYSSPQALVMLLTSSPPPVKAYFQDKI